MPGLRPSRLALRAVGLVVFLAPGLAGSVGADEISDVATIYGGRGDKLKKWESSPTVSVISAGNFDRASIQSTIDFINAQTGLNIPPPHSYPQTDSPSFYESAEFFLGRPRPGIGSGMLTLGGITINSDIYIFILDTARGTFLSVITGTAAHAPRLSRRFAEGSAHTCYFNISSYRGSIISGQIFINSGETPAAMRGCIYEELTQSMGLISDAEVSPYFTYDDLASDKPNNGDWKLLRTLYDPSIKPGDPVGAAVALYKSLFPISHAQ